MSCSNNLKQYVIGIIGHASDDNGRLQNYWDVRGRNYVNAINIENSTDPSKNPFSVEAIQPYILSFEFGGADGQPVNRSAMCPSIDANAMNAWVTQIHRTGLGNEREWTEYSSSYWVPSKDTFFGK